jgi:hypothetical protein
MSEIRYPGWQKPYEDVLAEPDSGRRTQKIDLAAIAVFKRLRETWYQPYSEEERMALYDALHMLRTLRTPYNGDILRRDVLTGHHLSTSSQPHGVGTGEHPKA